MRTPNRAIVHYCGAALIIDILAIAFLIHSTIVYEGQDQAAIAVLIGGPVSIGTLLVGVISGIAMGRHMQRQEQEAREVVA